MASLSRPSLEFVYLYARRILPVPQSILEICSRSLIIRKISSLFLGTDIIWNVPDVSGDPGILGSFPHFDGVGG